jgi:hypothetical protein
MGALMGRFASRVDEVIVQLLRSLQALSFISCGLAQPDTRRGRSDKGSARQRE